MVELSEGQLCAMEDQTTIKEPMIPEVEKGSENSCWVKKVDTVLQNQNPNETPKERVQAKGSAFKINSKDGKVRNPFAVIAKRRNSSMLNRPKVSKLDDVTVLQKQTKRLRKKGSSCLSGSEYDEDDKIEPFIIHGAALSKKCCKSATTQSHMSDSVLNSLTQVRDNETRAEKNEDHDSKNEKFPSAHEVADVTVLNQKKQTTLTNEEPIIEQPAIGKEGSTSESRDLVETALPTEKGYDIEQHFDKINEITSMKTMEISDESDCEITDFTQINDVTNSPTMEDIKYFIGFLPANKSCISDGFGWNEEMRRFYNYSWGGDHFRKDEIMRQMNRDNCFWAISDTDRNFIKTKLDKREKCINCYSFGHTLPKCPKQRKPLVCYMCGERGHLESRCPNTLCLQCGSKTSIYSNSCRKCINWNYLTCPICQQRGHSLNDCPDKWRRYHSTTKPNALLDSRIIYNKRRYCCFCGRQGHLSDECKNSLYRTEYPAISTEIRSHQNSYHDNIMSSIYQPEIPCRLLFDPKVNVNFGLAAKTTHNKVYGRFLCAVGLGHLIGGSCRLNKTQPESEVAVSSAELSLTEANCSSTISPAQVPEISESAN